MHDFHIWSIAKYEIKTLTRSWFFRIFGIIAIAVLFTYNLFLHTNIGSTIWDITAIPAGIPYRNLLILNIAQAIIAAFLASDFLRRDKKLDSTEVIYMRSMSNGDYVLGKTLGNLMVFLALNLIILIMAAIFNIVSETTQTDIAAYFQYLLYLSIPTLIFIMGLSFFVMSIIRNQGITFIILLGYIAIVLFYLKDKVNYLFDYMGYNVPMMKSDLAGFGNFHDVLLQRGLYLFLGLGFIFLTIVLLKRLPQSRLANIIFAILGGICITAGLSAAVIHTLEYFSVQEKKDVMIALNNKYSDHIMPSVTNHHIIFEHTGSSYKAQSKMILKNMNNKAVDEIILTLNPGLTVTNITIGGENVSITREMQIIVIPKSVQPDESIECQISYEGSIDENFCYLEMSSGTMQGLSEYYQKSFSFVQDNYVLLTPETNWYPVSGVSYSTSNPGWIRRDFTFFSLEVKDPYPLEVVSQGEKQSGANTIIFKTENPLPSLTLVIGNYDLAKTRPENVEFQLLYHPDHNYFKTELAEIQDTLSSIIWGRFQDFERRINLNYPYKHLKIVEVPVQFISFQHVWAGSYENVQPEIILIPEMGAGIRQANIRGNISNAKRFSRRAEQGLSDKDYQMMALNNFTNLFLNEQIAQFFNPNQRNVNLTDRTNRYYIFPQFFNFTNFITSPELPIFNRVLEAYLKSTFSDNRAFMARQITGISGDERANMALQNKSFALLLNDPDQSPIINNVIRLKGDILFSNIKATAGKEDFEEFLYQYLEDNKYKVTYFKDFESELNNRFSVNLSNFIEEWLNSKELPGFLFSKVEAENVRAEDMVKTMVQFKVSNLENVPGMLKIVFRLGGFGGRGGFGGGGFGGVRMMADNAIEKFVYLEGNQTKEISYLLDSPPRAMTINTMTSKNIPMEINNIFRRMNLNQGKLPFEGEIVVENKVDLIMPGEIVVDNEDPGFELIQPHNIGLFVRLVEKNMEEEEETYSGMMRRRIPENWTLTTNSTFFGKYIRSAYYVRKGDGNRIARWNLPVEEKGYYDVFFYLEQQQITQMRGFPGSRPGGGRGQESAGGRETQQQRDAGQYHFIIYHSEGQEELTVNINDIEGGWNNIGSFPFSKGTAIIELSNKGTGQMVIADAVKLVKEID